MAAYTVAACAVCIRLLVAPSGVRLRYAYNDQTLFEWMLEHSWRALSRADNPFFTSALNTPDGVNLLANTSMILPGVVLSPVTAVFGAEWTFALIVVGGIAGTAFGWYLALLRLAGISPIAAFVGGTICGFGPPMIAQSNGHPNLTFQVLVPWIVLHSLELTRRFSVKRALLLGVLIAAQYFTGQEVLFNTAMGLAIFVGLAAMIDPALRTRIRRLAGGLAVAATASLAILAGPIWLQFNGAHSYRHMAVSGWPGNDLSQLWTRSPGTFGVDTEAASRWAGTVTEQGPNLGVLFLAVLVGLAIWMRRSVVVRSLATGIVVLLWLSLGPAVHLHGSPHWLPHLWGRVFDLPGFDSVLPGRMALVALPFAAALTALGVDRLVDAARTATGGRRRVAAAGLVAVAVALGTLTPRPLEVIDRPSMPRFFTAAAWEDYVAPGRSIVFLPFPDPVAPEPMAWQADAGLGFSMPGGYFVGPGGPDRIGGWPQSDRPTARLIRDVTTGAKTADVSDEDRRLAAIDLCFWQADAAVLPDTAPSHAALLELGDELFGTGHQVLDVTVWPVPDVAADACSE